MTVNPRLTPEQLKEYESKAEKGDKEAIFWVGYCYDEGTGGVEADPTIAAHWWKKGVEHGSGKAKYMLAYCHDKGEGVEQDFDLSEALYEEAVEEMTIEADEPHNEVESQFYLGVCYDCARGTPSDSMQAAYWYTKAGEQGRTLAQQRLAEWYLDGHRVSKNLRQALYWYQKAASNKEYDDYKRVQECLDILKKEIKEEQTRLLDKFRACLKQLEDDGKGATASPMLLGQMLTSADRHGLTGLAAFHFVLVSSIPTILNENGQSKKRPPDDKR